MEFKLFPWQNDIEPYWVNPENGFEWYVDKELTNWCYRETLNNNPKLDAICFYIVEVNDDGERRALTRMLINKTTNEPIHEDTSLEGMASKIDILRVALKYDEEE